MSVSLLVVGHGSREAAGNAEIEQFAAQWRMQQPHWHIEVCFIEFADVLLADGLTNAARHAGQTGGEKAKVVILPLILNAASHVKEDIPQAMAAAQQQYPQVQFFVNTSVYSKFCHDSVCRSKTCSMPPSSSRA